MDTRCFIAFALCLAATACGNDSPSATDAGLSNEVPDAQIVADAAGETPDAAFAGGPALSCLGDAAPSTAADSIELSGALFDTSTIPVATLAGVTIELRRRGDDGLLDTAVTDDDGRYAFEISTGGVPVDAYFAVAADGFLPVRAFPPHPFVASFEVPLAIATTAVVDAWYAQLGTARDDSSGALIVFARDCEESAIEGSTVTSLPAGDAIGYWDDKAQAWDTSPAISNGFSLIANLPPGSIEVTVAHDTIELPAAMLDVPAGALTIAVVDPLAPGR